jgi:hypothetical protein
MDKTKTERERFYDAIIRRRIFYEEMHFQKEKESLEELKADRSPAGGVTRG